MRQLVSSSSANTSVFAQVMRERLGRRDPIGSDERLPWDSNSEQPPVLEMLSLLSRARVYYGCGEFHNQKASELRYTKSNQGLSFESLAIFQAIVSSLKESFDR